MNIFDEVQEQEQVETPAVTERQIAGFSLKTIVIVAAIVFVSAFGAVALTRSSGSSQLTTNNAPGQQFAPGNGQQGQQGQFGPPQGQFGGQQIPGGGQQLGPQSGAEQGPLAQILQAEVDAGRLSQDEADRIIAGLRR